MADVELDKVCNILDKLTLDSLLLMEQEIQLKLNIENSMCAGESNLAKARYIMGQNSVSSLKLPTENSPEFDSCVKVQEERDENAGELKIRRLELVKKNSENGDKVADPVKWFGYLVPQNLHMAQNMYRQALQWIVEAVNVQNRLEETCGKIQALKAYKKDILNCKK